MTKRLKELRFYLVDRTCWHKVTISRFCQIIISRGATFLDCAGTSSGPTVNGTVALVDLGAWLTRFADWGQTHVTATATGGTNSYGVYNYDGSYPSIRNSSITGTTNSIFNDPLSIAQVADTMLDGPVTAGTNVTCVGVYNAAFVALGIACA